MNPTAERQTVVAYSDVCIRHREHILFEHLDLTIYGGEFVYLTGSVGTGKSTLLKTMYAELPIASGSASVLDYDLLKATPRRVQELRRKLGIVFQDFRLLHDMTALENLDIILRAMGHRRRDTRLELIDSALSRVGLSNKGYKYPHELSGGEQQRVAIARAILTEPRLILADEPTANLDLANGLQIAELLHSIGRELGTTVVMATHNRQVIEQYPARVLDMQQFAL